MHGVKKHTRKMGYGSSYMPTADPNAREDTCLLCGHYLPLNDDGYCCGDECFEACRIEIRRRAAGRRIVPGMYYLMGNQEVFLFGELERWREPEVPESFTDANGVTYTCSADDSSANRMADMCESAGCDSIARPKDVLCIKHRMEATQEHRRSQPKATRRRFSKTHTKGSKKAQSHTLTHHIKGLDTVKVK